MLMDSVFFDFFEKILRFFNKKRKNLLTLCFGCDIMYKPPQERGGNATPEMRTVGKSKFLEN